VRTAALGLAGLLALVLGYALLAKGIPSLYPDYGRVARLRSPIGYWNELALLGDLALVLGLWRAAGRRLDGALLVFGGTLTCLLAYSRGGVVIGLLLAGAWLAVDRRRLESLAALAVGGGAGVAVAAISLALPGIADDGQAHSVRAHDGRIFLLVVVVAGLLVAAVARFLQRVEPGPESRRRASLALGAAIALAAVGGIAGVALHSGGSTTPSAAGAHCVTGAGRFACSSSDERLDWWKEAWQSFTAHPLDGTGAGSFDLAHRLRRAHFTRPVTEPHNLALQALGETGIVGFALFAAAVAFAALAVRSRLRGRDPALVVLALCLLAYLAHVLIDVGYDFVAVSAPVFVVLGLLLAPSSGTAPRREPVWSLGTLLLAGTAILSLAAPYIASHKVDVALQKLDPSIAAQAHSWNPVAVEPLLVEAALIGTRDRQKALDLFHQAVDTQPDNPDTWVQLGEFELDEMKNPCAAYRYLNQAYTLDRFDPDVAQKGGALDRARTQVNAHGCG
jgi:hypothetical protein